MFGEVCLAETDTRRDDLGSARATRLAAMMSGVASCASSPRTDAGEASTMFTVTA
jgi:hypothetical protein